MKSNVLVLSALIDEVSIITSSRVEKLREVLVKRYRCLERT